ncbi:MAG: hypothetical protein U9N52_03225 [Campylobacterota bacterium]|nr:hypothetical protein [Campylobacterota bacterium]
MYKYLVLIVPLLLLSAEITLDIDTTREGEVTYKEINMLKSSFQAKRIIIEDDEAKKVIEKNRYLYQTYLKDSKIPENIRINFILELEKQLALEVIRANQEDITIDDETLESYYVANKQEFNKPETISFSIYTIPNFDEGVAVYNKLRKEPQNIESYAKDHNYTKNDYTSSIIRIDRSIQSLIVHNNAKPPYILPPQYYQGAYRIFSITAHTQEGMYEFSDVKDKITTILHKKAYLRMKNKLLKPYNKQNEE